MKHRQFFHELVDWLADHMSFEPDDAEIENALVMASMQFEKNDNEVSLRVFQALLTLAGPHVRYLRLRQAVDTLSYALECCEDIYVQGRSTLPAAEINIFRQGFLLLMTAFDAAIYDLMRAALHKDFFSLIQQFTTPDKLTIQDIGKKGTFDSLQSDIVEQQLKRMSISDLLLAFQKFGAKCCKSKDEFPRLLELVLRRHLHVHNRGKVDERYLQAKYNLDKLKVGDTAAIDEAYWDTAMALTQEAIDATTEWIMKSGRKK